MTTTRPRGRPRSPARTDLVAALILKQDSMSRRTAMRVNRLLATHLSRGDVERAWGSHVCTVRALLDPLPGTLAPLITQAARDGVGAVERLLAARVADS